MAIVFSTNPDFHFDEPETQPETLAPSEQRLHVQMERKGRGGKTATVVSGFVGSDDDLADLARTLKTKCGVGGSAKDGIIIIQGDCVPKVRTILAQLGYTVK